MTHPVGAGNWSQVLCKNCHVPNCRVIDLPLQLASFKRIGRGEIGPKEKELSKGLVT